jgi:lysophospholipase L1-like esterase
MYNPASVLHTVERFEGTPRVVFITLGTNHVYRLKETGEIVDNCQKRPAALFQEEELTVDECADYLRQTVELLCRRRPDVHVVFTVSPIRYRKYGYHESQLSKATLLLAVDKVCIGLNGLSRTSQTNEACVSPCPSVAYFPAYEIVLDELRDYRFYADDMAHPSPVAVDYVFSAFCERYFTAPTAALAADVRKLTRSLSHRPLTSDDNYKSFLKSLLSKFQSFASQHKEVDLSGDISDLNKRIE